MKFKRLKTLPVGGSPFNVRRPIRITELKYAKTPDMFRVLWKLTFRYFDVVSIFSQGTFVLGLFSNFFSKF